MGDVKGKVTEIEKKSKKKFDIEGTFEYYARLDWIQNWNDRDKDLENELTTKLQVGKKKLIQSGWEGVSKVSLTNTPDQPIRDIKITKWNLAGKSINLEDIKNLLETAIQTSRQRIIDKYKGGGEHKFSIRGEYKSSCGIIALDTFIIDGNEFESNGDIKTFIAGKNKECEKKGGKRKTRRYKRKRARFSKKAK